MDGWMVLALDVDGVSRILKSLFLTIWRSNDNAFSLGALNCRCDPRYWNISPSKEQWDSIATWTHPNVELPKAEWDSSKRSSKTPTPWFRLRVFLCNKPSRCRWRLLEAKDGSSDRGRRRSSSSRDPAFSHSVYESFCSEILSLSHQFV